MSDRSAAGIGSSRTTRVVPPTSIVSPTDSVCGPVIRRPLTNVPLVEPRSSIAQKPLRSKLIRACEREISSSSASRPAPSAWRPISNSSSSRIDIPIARPATTSKRATAWLMCGMYRSVSGHCADPGCLQQSAAIGRLRPAMARLRVVSGPNAGQTVDVEEEIVIGREDTDLTIDDDELSRRHAVVRRHANRLQVEDLGSTNGTFVDGTRIAEPTLLGGGAEIKIGTTVLVVEGVLPVSDSSGDIAVPRNVTRVSPAIAEGAPPPPSPASPVAPPGASAVASPAVPALARRRRRSASSARPSAARCSAGWRRAPGFRWHCRSARSSSWRSHWSSISLNTANCGNPAALLLQREVQDERYGDEREQRQWRELGAPAHLHVEVLVDRRVRDVC